MSIVASIEARIKEYETAITNSLANHNGLIGGLSELKNLLAMAKDVAEVALPEAEPALVLAAEIVDNIDSALE